MLQLVMRYPAPVGEGGGGVRWSSVTSVRGGGRLSSISCPQQVQKNWSMLQWIMDGGHVLFCHESTLACHGGGGGGGDTSSSVVGLPTHQPPPHSAIAAIPPIHASAVKIFVIEPNICYVHCSLLTPNRSTPLHLKASLSVTTHTHTFYPLPTFILSTFTPTFIG